MLRMNIIFALLSFFVIAAFSVCTPPSTITITNQPALDSDTPSSTAGSGIVINNAPTNDNNTRLLQIAIDWSLVENRTVELVSIGATPSHCSSFIASAGGSSPVNGWKVTHDTTGCTSQLFAQFLWPEALYNSNCRNHFAELYGTTAYTLEFDVYITYTDYVPIDRSGERIWTNQTSQVIVPVVLEYPLTVNVSMSNLRIFAENSIDIDVTLTAQTIQNTSPYHVKFSSFISRSFAIFPTSITYYNGTDAPHNVSVAADGSDTLVSPALITRTQYWDITIFPGDGKCQFDGYYQINVTIYWTGINETGAALPSSDNPIPNNVTASFGFQLDSQYFCGTTLSNSLSAAMTTFIDAPATSGGHTANTAHTGFLQNDIVYFRAIVSSLNLPIANVVLTTLEAQQGSNSPVSLVANGAIVPANDVSYQVLDSTINNEPDNETNWQLVVDEDVFPVNQDRSLTYTFNAVLTVTYQTGLKKRMSLRQNAAATSNTKATATIALQRATDSSTNSLSATAVVVLFSMFIGLYLLL